MTIDFDGRFDTRFGEPKKWRSGVPVIELLESDDGDEIGYVTPTISHGEMKLEFCTCGITIDIPLQRGNRGEILKFFRDTRQTVAFSYMAEEWFRTWSN